MFSVSSIFNGKKLNLCLPESRLVNLFLYLCLSLFVTVSQGFALHLLNNRKLYMREVMGYFTEFSYLLILVL